MTVVVDEAALEGPDVLPAGAELAAALDALDPAGTTGQDAAAWMRAAFRQRNRQDWLLLVTLREACSARAGTTERVELDEFAPKIAAASLGWTTGMATARLDVAVGVLERMPALGERMRAGTLELAKATQFVTGLQGLTDAQARAVVAALLDDAPDLGLGELRDRILDAGYAVDRVWGANRLAAATARARVTAETAPSGAVNLCGRDLPPELAQDAKARLRTLALAARARLRAAGRKVGLGFVEARVFVRLMDGTQAGLPDAEIIATVTTELSQLPATDDPDDEGGGPGDGGPRDDGPHDGPDDDGPGDHGPEENDPAGDDAGGPSQGPDDGDPDDHGWCPGDASVVFAPGTAVRLTLSTLLGLDDEPGALPGLGPVPAGTARTAALAHGSATWHVLVHDERGHLEHLLVLRAPPHAVRDPRHRRRTVELTATAELIHALDPEATAHEADPLGRARATALDGATTAWLRRLREALVRSEEADPEDHPATTTRERDRRFPGAALARWVAARDQTCIALGCTRRAEVCDIDHTLDWIRGGRTEADDLDLLCRHDHRAKHQAGWTYTQPTPGRFLITDPTGTRHRVESRVTHPRPAPVEPGHGISPDPGEPRPRPDWAPNRTRDGRITEEARATAERLTRRARAQEGARPSRYDSDPDF